MNNHHFYSDFLLFYVSWKIDIILADRSELWTSIPAVGGLGKSAGISACEAIK